jgi:hypothetical protein
MENPLLPEGEFKNYQETYLKNRRIALKNYLKEKELTNKEILKSRIDTLDDDMLKKLRKIYDLKELPIDFSIKNLDIELRQSIFKNIDKVDKSTRKQCIELFDVCINLDPEKSKQILKFADSQLQGQINLRNSNNIKESMINIATDGNPRNLYENMDKVSETLRKSKILKTTVENEENEENIGEKTPIYLRNAIFAAIAVAVVCALLINNESEKQNNIKKRNSKQRNLSNTTNIPDDLKVALMLWYYNQVNGCYLIKNNGITRLDGCSDFYGNIDNQINCSCGESTENMSSPKCDNQDECLKPYCLGNPNCSGDKSIKCSNEILYQCTGNSVDDPNFTSYMYIDNSIFSLYSNFLNFQDIIKKDEDKNKNNILLYVIIFVVVIFIISFVIFLMKRSKKYKKSKN